MRKSINSWDGLGRLHEKKVCMRTVGNVVYLVSSENRKRTFQAWESLLSRVYEYPIRQ